MEGELNAQTYLNVNARLAYYDAMKNTASVRVEKALPSPGLRKRQGLFQRQRRVSLIPAGTQHA
jgi:hypothetical protein